MRTLFVVASVQSHVPAHFGIVVTHLACQVTHRLAALYRPVGFDLAPASQPEMMVPAGRLASNGADAARDELWPHEQIAVADLATQQDVAVRPARVDVDGGYPVEILTRF